MNLRGYGGSIAILRREPVSPLFDDSCWDKLPDTRKKLVNKSRLPRPPRDVAEALLADVASNPHPRDSTLKLILADWLDEHGRHREAAFWRECALEGWHPDQRTTHRWAWMSIPNGVLFTQNMLPVTLFVKLQRGWLIEEDPYGSRFRYYCSRKAAFVALRDAWLLLNSQPKEAQE